MDDKNLMEDILLLEKGVCDLYMHGTLESPTSNVHQAFSTALNDSLCMQDTLYDKMAAKGWYPTEQADQNKVNSVKQSSVPSKIALKTQPHAAGLCFFFKLLVFLSVSFPLFS